MNLREFHRHFIDGLTPPWLEGEKAGNTCDCIISGDGDKPVETVLVSWIASMGALQAAVDRRVDLLLVHEPVFYGLTADRFPDVLKDCPSVGAKARFIAGHDIAIMRLHDRWDIWPQYGIPYAWAKFLGFSGPPVAIHKTVWPGTLHRYDMPPMTLGDFARRVAARTATVGEPHPLVVGDLDAMVSKVGVGTGCGCQVMAFRELGCDVSMICDDGSCYWHEIQRWEDEGHPVIRVNHGTSEEPGMESLARYINEKMPPVRAEYLPVARKFHQV
ncbi:MAG: Nif3-like dinuclear metal center hexameric protein [Planctomycetaceae bacterium]|nr:Nif3-like dinuclear metal center hexameric protein [Planctomycetaceae bacterium]